MWDSTWIHVLQMNSNPSFWCASIWLAKRCSTCQWSAMVVCRFILHDSCNSTCEQSRIIQKCSSSCLWKVTQILKLQTLCQTLERPETQGGWPQVCRKTLRLRMQPSPDCLWKVSIWPRWFANALLANFGKLAVWSWCEKNAEFGACFCCSEFIENKTCSFLALYQHSLRFQSLFFCQWSL